MKHKKLIVAALLATTLLSGCGDNQATEVMAPVESQVSEVTQVDENWYQNKVFQAPDTGYYFWVKNMDGHLFFLVGYTPEENGNETCVAVIPEKEYTVQTHEEGNQYLQYVQSDKDIISINYVIDAEQVVLLVQNKEGQYSHVSGVYNVVEPQQEQQPTEQPDLSNNTEFPEFSQWECFETFSGEDITVSVEVQSGDPVLILPEAKFIVLERNGADTAWEFINEDFTDSRVYTTVTYYGDQLVISSTEDWKWDGTYIQLPDTTEE